MQAAVLGKPEVITYELQPVSPAHFLMPPGKGVITGVWCDAVGEAPSAGRSHHAEAHAA